MFIADQVDLEFGRGRGRVFFDLHSIRVRHIFEFYFFIGRITIYVGSFQLFLSPLNVFVQEVGHLLPNYHAPEPHHVDLQIED